MTSPPIVIDDIRRLPVSELAFPVLFLQKNLFFIWRDVHSMKPWRGLLIDGNGCSYQAVDVHVPVDPFGGV